MLKGKFLKKIHKGKPTKANKKRNYVKHLGAGVKDGFQPVKPRNKGKTSQHQKNECRKEEQIS